MNERLPEFHEPTNEDERSRSKFPLAQAPSTRMNRNTSPSDGADMEERLRRTIEEDPTDIEQLADWMARSGRGPRPKALKRFETA